jgi:hypothetical protein
VSRPEIWPSVEANCTATPGWMVSVDPFGTVMSPCTMYGLPDVVQVWLMMLPPVMVVLASAGAAMPTAAATRKHCTDFASPP